MKTLFRVAFMAVVLATAGADASGTAVEDRQLTVHRLAIKGKSWALDMSLPMSFFVIDNSASDNGSYLRFIAIDSKSGIAVGAFLKNVRDDGNAAAARDYFMDRLAKIPSDPANITHYEVGDLAFSEYSSSDYEGGEVHKKSLHCFLSHDGYWMDVHISKRHYQSKDRAAFDSILETIRISAIDQAEMAGVPGAELFELPVPQHGSLIFSILASWKRKVEKAPDKLPPTLILRPGKGNSFELMITPLWSPKNDVEFNKPKKLKEFIKAGLSQMLPSAVEKDVAIQEFNAVDGPGYYFIVTDKAPGPGEFPLAMLSTVGVGDLILSVTLLFRDKGSGDVEATIKMLQGVCQGSSKIYPLSIFKTLRPRALG